MLEARLNELQAKAARYAEQNIEECGISETINNDEIRKTKMAIEIAKAGGVAEVDVLVHANDEFGGVPGEIASKKMICKYDACWMLVNPGDATDVAFVKSGRKPAYYLKNFGVRVEKRIVPVQILQHVDSCYRSRFFLGQSDKAHYSK